MEKARKTQKKKTIGGVQLKKAGRELAEAFARLESAEDIERAFVDFLTVSERRALYSRWMIFKLLDQGVTQRDISRALGVSLCKITRGSRFLKSSKTIVKRMLQESEVKGENDNDNESGI